MTDNSRIAVYGATGFTGQLIVTELLRWGVRPVLVGRDVERMAAVAGPGVTIRRAGLDEPDALAAAFDGCRVVISSVAPFTRWGEPVVRAALAAGVHYVDVTGEQAYVKQIHDIFACDAEQAGVSVVCAATDTGLGDPLAHLVAARLGAVDKLTIGHLIGMAQPSRGTLRSVLAIAAGQALQYVEEQWRTAEAETTSLRFPGSAEPTPVVGVAATEVVTVPRHVKARRVEGVIDTQTVSALAAITPEMIENLPSGPGADSRGADTFAVAIEATGADGSGARGFVRGFDVYGTTAAVCVETAMRLASDTAPPGVIALAEVSDPEDLLTALAGQGVTWGVAPNHPRSS